MPFVYTKQEGLAVLVASLPSTTPPTDFKDAGLCQKKSMLQDGGDTPDSEDTYLLVDEEFQVENEDRSEIVHSLYEGPRTCQCCTNWVDERPADYYEKDEEKVDEKAPILVRRKRISDGSKIFQIDSIQIQSAPLRTILAKVFDRYDHITPTLANLTFRPPFRPFYWRWEEFETTIKEEKDEKLAKQLKCLRNLVKSEMAGLFDVSRELQDNGIIEHHLLWTLFKPGELLYSKDHERERFYVLNSVSLYGLSFTLQVRSLDWNGRHLGFSSSSLHIRHFIGTSRIVDLTVFPARFLDNLEEVKERVIERGKKFIELAGVHHKSYKEEENVSGNKAGADLRIIIDAESHPRKPALTAVYEQNTMPIHSGLISQIPPAAEPPPGCHIPLATIVAPMPPPIHSPMPPPPPPPPMLMAPPPPPPPRLPIRKKRRPSNCTEDSIEMEEERHEIELSEFHFLLANPNVRGFRLKDKEWTEFDIGGVHDIQWSPECFDSLVLPDGYKDLVLAHVENQLNGEESFDDVINGKGGGLVILLSGPPGVGKTLTVESVAERMRAPLYKMDLHTGGIFPSYDPDDLEEEIEESFNRAMKWDAVLLIDECDTYLQKRSDQDATRNRIVAAFLQNLEYYPSLLFLTTNRADSLDIALQSRVDLTINYPNLDFLSRHTIWKNFLFGRGLNTEISDKQLETLAHIELNGRRIKNVVKTSLVMAKSQGRGLQYEDVEKVLKITEGLTLTG